MRCWSSAVQRSASCVGEDERMEVKIRVEQLKGLSIGSSYPTRPPIPVLACSPLPPTIDPIAP